MSIPTWISRVSALALLLVVIGFLQLMVGQPLIDSFAEHRSSIARSQAMLARFTQLNESRPQMHGQLQKVQEAYDSQERLLSGGNSQLAGAALQNRLKSLVDAGSAEMGSMKLLPDREEEGFRRISVSISFTSTIDSLRSILYEIETQTPYLFVESLELRRNRNFANSSGADDTGELKVQLDAFGYMLIE